MIIQGTNNPLIFTFSEPMTTVADIEISLYTEDKTAGTTTEWKHWTLEDVEINETEVIANIKQEESILFPEGKCFIEVKWMNALGRTEFAKILSTNIVKRNDKTIMEGAAID